MALFIPEITKLKNRVVLNYPSTICQLCQITVFAFFDDVNTRQSGKYVNIDKNTLERFFFKNEIIKLGLILNYSPRNVGG